MVSAPAMTTPIAMTSHRPARVSSILRSSTRTSRAKGMPEVGRSPGIGDGRSGVVPGGRHGRGSGAQALVGRGAHAATSSRAEAAVRSKNISSSPRSSPERSSRSGIPAVEGRAPDGLGVGVREEPAGGDRADGDARGLEGQRQRGVVGGPDDGAGAGEQLLGRALRDDLPVPDDDDVVGDPLDLVEQVRAEQHRAAAGGEARAAGRASSGCRPGRGRWRARRG